MDDDEYSEALTKAEVLGVEYPSFELLETLKLDRGEYTLLGNHVDRLVRSARYFGFPLAELRVIQALQEHAIHHDGASRRVRLLVSKEGNIRVESVPLRGLAVGAMGAMTVALAHTPVAKENRFLFHKTTNRTWYENSRARSPEAFDCCGTRTVTLRSLQTGM